MVDILHSVLTGTDLHEPKGITGANLGEVYVADGNGSGSWQAQITLALPPKFISGFTIENATVDTTNDITLLAGSCRDSGDTEDIKLTSSLTKRLDAAWAAGTNQGGLDAGSVTNTTYHMFVIKNTTTGVVDALFSTSVSSPTMPTGYDKKRRVASFKRGGGANQAISTVETGGGGIEVLTTPDDDTSSVSTSPSLHTLTAIPSGLKLDSIISGIFTATANGVHLLISPPDIADTAPSSSICTTVYSETAATDVVPGSFQLRVRTDTSGRIRVRADGTGNIFTNTQGWVDWRR